MASTAEMKDENHWGGASRPLGARYGKLMMWFFLLSDALTFSGFLTAYGLMRFKYEKLGLSLRTCSRTSRESKAINHCFTLH